MNNTIRTDTINVNAATRDQLIGLIVNNAALNNDLQNENKYSANEYAFKLLDEYPAFITLGANEDAIYQNFYDSVNNSNIGKLNQIGKYINIKNYSSANALNLTLTGTNTIENNRIAVNNIYLNKLVNKQPLGESDSLTLMNIAYQSSQTGGDAVFSARVILGIDVINKVDNNQTNPINPQDNVINLASIKVYPNPANKQFTIEFKDVVNNALIEVYSSIGNLVLTDNMQGVYIKNIDVSNLNDGFYFYKITINGTKFSSGKLTILNK